MVYEKYFRRAQDGICILMHAHVHAHSYAPVHSSHLAAGADPFSIGNFRERRVEAVNVVGGGAGVTAKQLPSILAHTAELNVVVVFFLHPFIPPVFLILPFGLR